MPFAAGFYIVTKEPEDAPMEAVAQHSRTVELPVELTFPELVDGYCNLHFDGVDLMLRKWREL